MRESLSHIVGGRVTNNPAALLRDLTVLSQDGIAHQRRWEGVIDTGADVCILPSQIGRDMFLVEHGQFMRVSSYRKDDPPRELPVYYVRLLLPSGFLLPTLAVLSERRNILIGRSALQQMRLTINWPANFWSLEEISLPRRPGSD